MAEVNVRVYCRMRPFVKREIELGNLNSPMMVTPNEIIVLQDNRRFNFDYCFGSDASQDEVFGIVGQAVVSDFMGGFNATQFVYGQTGAGKTWTMMGLKDNPELCGLTPRSAALIFQLIGERPDGWAFEIEVSYLEIYMERVNDLLNLDKQNLEIKENTVKGIYVDGLTRESIATLDDVYDVIERGDKLRKVASTKMNAGSSRSHSVLTFYLQQTGPDGAKISSQLHLVDLAGSERVAKTGATGEVLKQATVINLSLTVLCQVINKLSVAKKGDHIPYRDSKLTRLLQTSLGGNSKTGLSIHVSPHIDNLEESISTMEFGRRAKLIKTSAKAKIQRSAEQLEIELERLQQAYDKLKDAFQQLSKGKLPKGMLLDGPETPAVTSEAEKRRIADLEEAAKTSKKEIDDLRNEISALEEQLAEKFSEATELQKDYEIKDLEVRALQMKLRELGAADEDINLGGGDDDEIVSKQPGMIATNTVAGFKSTNPNQNAAIAELNSLVGKQKEVLNRVRLENKELKKENLELTDELEEKTRKLALAELQVMRYENARNRLKDSKIKFKIPSGKPKPNPIWRNLLENVGQPDGSAVKVDYERIRRGTILERFGSLHPVPPEELVGGREGMLEERLYQKTKFVQRWFVLRDSFLFCYESEQSPRNEPRFCIPLADSKIGSCPKQVDHEFCFMVLCGTYFNVMAAQTESEKTVWLRDLNNGKFVTHENLMGHAHFNRLSIRAIPDAAEQESFKTRFQSSPYSRLGDSEYVHEVPACGGMEGFLACQGTKVPGTVRTERPGYKDVRKEWKAMYFVVKDSHLLIYDLIDHSDLITEPRIAVYMGGNVKVVKQHEEAENPDDENDVKMTRFYFAVVDLNNEMDSIAVYATSDAERDRWLLALNSATLVTTRYVMMAALEKENITAHAGISAPEQDLQGNTLDPLCVQAYDDNQKPLYRHPDGRIVTRDMKPVGNETKRFSKSGQPLDPYHRPRPPNAVAMFAANPREPLGVGVDGKHYAYPSGRELSSTDPHFDYEGQKIIQETVDAANQIVPALVTACIVRSAILTRDKNAVFDGLGRALRRTRDGKLLTLEGQPLPESAAVFDSFGSRTKYKPSASGAVKTLEVIYYANDASVVSLGKLGIEVGRTTLADVFAELKKAFSSAKVTSIVFLVKGVPIPEKDRELRLASDFLPRIVVSCRDGHGKRAQFTEANYTPFVTDINHEAIDQAVAKESENEFIKVVNSHKHRKSTQVGGSSTTLNSSRTNTSMLATPRFDEVQ